MDTNSNAKWFTLNTDCLLLDPTAEVSSCEDCPCAGCRAVVDAEPEAQDAYNEWFYTSCLQGDDLPQVPAELGPNVDLIALEVLADRLAGHRTSYLLA